jgi:hypothetical protein
VLAAELSAARVGARFNGSRFKIFAPILAFPRRTGSKIGLPLYITLDITFVPIAAKISDSESSSVNDWNGLNVLNDWSVFFLLFVKFVQ